MQPKPKFTKSELDAIFNPLLLKKVYTGQSDFQTNKIESETESYRNTKVSPRKLEKIKSKEMLQQSIMDKKLRAKIESESHLYDFKVIQTKLEGPSRDKMYLTPGEVSEMVRQPQIQRSANHLLNLFHKHQFSFD